MIAITGAPGTGKTTYAATLGLKTLHTDDWLHVNRLRRAGLIAKELLAVSGEYGVVEGTLVPWVLRFMLNSGVGITGVSNLVIMTKVHKYIPGTEGLAGAVDSVLADINRDLRKQGIIITYNKLERQI